MNPKSRTRVAVVALDARPPAGWAGAALDVGTADELAGGRWPVPLSGLVGSDPCWHPAMAMAARMASDATAMRWVCRVTVLLLSALACVVAQAVELAPLAAI